MSAAIPTNTPILVTGCQRSGTTLASLILDSHPLISSIDEMHFDTHHIDDYLTNQKFHPYVLLKLPTIAPEINSISKPSNEIVNPYVAILNPMGRKHATHEYRRTASPDTRFNKSPGIHARGSSRCSCASYPFASGRSWNARNRECYANVAA